MTPRRTTYPNLKRRRKQRLFVKRGVAEDVYAWALQRLSDMVNSYTA
jgi:hypothetical protein